MLPGLGFICAGVKTTLRRVTRVATDLALASGCEGHVDEAVGVGEALLGAALGGLLLLLGLDLGGLRLDFALRAVSAWSVTRN